MIAISGGADRQAAAGTKREVRLLNRPSPPQPPAPRRRLRRQRFLDPPLLRPVNQYPGGLELYVERCVLSQWDTPTATVPAMLHYYPQTVLRTAAIGLELTPQTSDASPPPRILIIEDELLIALMIEEMCREAGYRVSGVAHTVKMARYELAKRNFDAVLLDISMGGKRYPESADRLVAKGIPFAFVTGYDYLVEPRHEKIPVLQKPFSPVQLRDLLKTLVGPGSSSGDVAQTA
jgi:CheY-like chemotaxis protein